MPMNPYQAMMKAGPPQQQNPNAHLVGSKEAGLSYKQYAQKLGEELDALQQQYGHLTTIPPDIAHHIIRKGHEYENAINKWQEYEGRGIQESDATNQANQILSGRGASRPLFDGPPGASGPMDIPGALEQAASGRIPTRK